MNATKTGLAANIVGIVGLLLGMFGIELDSDSQATLIGAAGIVGLIINQVVIAWAQRQQPNAPQSGLEPPRNAGFATPHFVGVLVVLMVAMLALPGCATLGNVDQSKLVTQIAVMKVIEADKDHAAERAAKIREVANDAQIFLDGADVSVPLLADAINARLAGLDLQPSDRVLAAALVDAVVAELNARVGGGMLSPEQRYTVSQVLGWIESAAALY